MPSATKIKAARQRELIEQLAVGARTGSPLRIDEDAGVIFRVKVLGRYSRNNHGLTEAENGTEYSPNCMKAALADYEERKVKCDHPPDRSNPGRERSIEATFGVLRNCVIESDEHGEPAIWADLHCLTNHPMYPRVIEDVKKGLGVYGLSHNASARRERFDRATKRLVIEELAQVRSVDLVDKPATNRTLWESERRPMTKSLRELLEAQRPKLSKPRKKWCDVLLEDDAMAPVMDAPMEPADIGGEDADDEDAFTAGVKHQVMSIIDDDSLDAAGKLAKIKLLLTTHEKLMQDNEPEEPEEVEESDDEDEEGKGKKKPDDAMESEELRSFRREKAARELCESMGYQPTSLQIEAVAGIRDARRQRELAESYKPTGTKPGFKTPRSAPPGGGKPPAEKKTGRDVQESEDQKKASVAGDLAILRNG